MSRSESNPSTGVVYQPPEKLSRVFRFYIRFWFQHFSNRVKRRRQKKSASLIKLVSLESWRQFVQLHRGFQCLRSRYTRRQRLSRCSQALEIKLHRRLASDSFSQWLRLRKSRVSTKKRIMRVFVINLFTKKISHALDLAMCRRSLHSWRRKARWPQALELRRKRALSAAVRQWRQLYESSLRQQHCVRQGSAYLLHICFSRFVSRLGSRAVKHWVVRQVRVLNVERVNQFSDPAEAAARHHADRSLRVVIRSLRAAVTRRSAIHKKNDKLRLFLQASCLSYIRLWRYRVDKCRLLAMAGLRWSHLAKKTVCRVLLMHARKVVRHRMMSQQWHRRWALKVLWQRFRLFCAAAKDKRATIATMSQCRRIYRLRPQLLLLQQQCVRVRTARQLVVEVQARRMSQLCSRLLDLLAARLWTQKQQTSIVCYHLFGRAIRRWRVWSSSAALVGVAQQRAQLRSSVQCLMRAMVRLKRHADREISLRRGLRVFRLLHPTQESIPIRLLFEAWRNVFVVQRKRLRWCKQQIMLRRRQRCVDYCWEAWSQVYSQALCRVFHCRRAWEKMRRLVALHQDQWQRAKRRFRRTWMQPASRSLRTRLSTTARPVRDQLFSSETLTGFWRLRFLQRMCSVWQRETMVARNRRWEHNHHRGSAVGQCAATVLLLQRTRSSLLSRVFHLWCSSHLSRRHQLRQMGVSLQCRGWFRHWFQLSIHRRLFKFHQDSVVSSGMRIARSADSREVNDSEPSRVWPQCLESQPGSSLTEIVQGVETKKLQLKPTQLLLADKAHMQRLQQRERGQVLGNMDSIHEPISATTTSTMLNTTTTTPSATTTAVTAAATATVKRRGEDIVARGVTVGGSRSGAARGGPFAHIRKQKSAVADAGGGGRWWGAVITESLADAQQRSYSGQFEKKRGNFLK